MKVYKKELKDYSYLLPEKNLIIFDYFFNIDKYLPRDSFLVLNNTKVLPARITMKKSTGGKVILLFLVNELMGSGVVKAMADRDENIKQKKLHEEYFEVDLSVLQSINRLKQEGKKLVAVGTTVTRTLETFAKSKIKLITNFHLPKSSLMMLVEAFLQHKKAKKSLIELYNMAIINDFRFYSFGDAMVII